MRDLIQNKVNNQFAVKYNRLLQKKDSLTQLDSALLYYVYHPVNKDGFCSIPFKTYSGGKKKVLLLGDSFTWGRTVNNITTSFANELLARGYAVYNTGISGADPQQYLALAKKYIPLLKPDFVIVNFAMGSDIMYTPREVKPFEPIFYRTNAGYLFSCPQGVFIESAEKAYQFIFGESSIPRTTFFNKFCALTTTGTMVWRLLFHLDLLTNEHPGHANYWEKVQSITKQTPFCNNYLDSIRKIADVNSATCIISAIPDLRKGGVCNPANQPHLFDNIPYVVSPVKTEGYSLTDGHFNDLGHFQYALFLDSLMNKP
jgi:hypothetical protein